jgi:hypothetical protein
LLRVVEDVSTEKLKMGWARELHSKRVAGDQRRLFDAMMRKPPAERLMMSLDMMATARELVMQGIQREAGAV